MGGHPNHWSNLVQLLNLGVCVTVYEAISGFFPEIPMKSILNERLLWIPEADGVAVVSRRWRQDHTDINTEQRRSEHVLVHVNFIPAVSCSFHHDEVPIPTARTWWPCGLVRMNLMSAICQLARCCDPNRAFKGDFQTMSVMAFSSTTAQLQGLYYHCRLFTSTDLDLSETISYKRYSTLLHCRLCWWLWSDSAASMLLWCAFEGFRRSF